MFENNDLFGFEVFWIYSFFYFIKLTLAGETEASEPVTVLVLPLFPRGHLRRGVRNVEKRVALPVMAVMHTLSSSTPPSPEAGADVIVGQPGLAAAMGGLDRSFVMVMVMVRSWNIRANNIQLCAYTHIFLSLKIVRFFYRIFVIKDIILSILLILLLVTLSIIDFYETFISFFSFLKIIGIKKKKKNKKISRIDF